MSRTDGKKMYVIKDIWVNYVQKLLVENPEWWTRHEKGTPHYRLYRKQGTRVIEVNNYGRFRQTLELYFMKARMAIINGEAINMTNGVGKICAKRVERDFRKERQRRINWQKTKQQPLVWSEEKQKMVYKTKVYYTTDDWCRIGWMKSKKVQNETVYQFSPTRPNSAGTSGFVREFIEALNRDPLLKFKYLYQPIHE